MTRLTPPCLQERVLRGRLAIQVGQRFRCPLKAIHHVVVRLSTKGQDHLACHWVCFRVPFCMDFYPTSGIKVPGSLVCISNCGPHPQLFASQSCDDIPLHSLPRLLNCGSWHSCQDLKCTLAHKNAHEVELAILLLTWTLGY